MDAERIVVAHVVRNVGTRGPRRLVVAQVVRNAAGSAPFDRLRAHRLAAVAQPVRTCAGCRQRAEKASLLRIVARDGVGVPDPAQNAPGRGVYVHRSPACLDQAVRRRSLGKALRTEIDGPRTAEAIRIQLGAVT